MAKPNNDADWKAVLTAIDWARLDWLEAGKAINDMYHFGQGYLRVTHKGIEHVPMESVRLELSASDPHEG